MKLLSIDVGIKNLAYCLMEYKASASVAGASVAGASVAGASVAGPSASVAGASASVAGPNASASVPSAAIIKWDVINLCGKDPSCSFCIKPAKYAHKITHYCTVHAKKSGMLLPSPAFSLKKIKKMKIIDLQKVIDDYTIPLAPFAVKKEELLNSIIQFMDQKMLGTVSSAKANDMDLIQIGIAARKAFDIELADHLSTITHIVIENQISPIANRMKTLQGMIAQYFIMQDITQIVFVSAANKLKGHQDIETDLTTYAARKKEGINITLKLLNERFVDWVPHFSQHKKKDDLADAFLQGNWYATKQQMDATKQQMDATKQQMDATKQQPIKN